MYIRPFFCFSRMVRSLLSFQLFKNTPIIFPVRKCLQSTYEQHRCGLQQTRSKLNENKFFFQHDSFLIFPERKQFFQVYFKFVQDAAANLSDRLNFNIFVKAVNNFVCLKLQLKCMTMLFELDGINVEPVQKR